MYTATDITIKTFFSTAIVTGVVGNILVCLVVLLNKPMRTPMNYLLVNLAISDIMLLLFFSPAFIFRGSFVHPGGLTGDILCALVTGETLAWIGGYSSTIFLLAISIERYIAVAKPRSYGRSFVTKNLKLIVCGCWLFSLAWNAIGFKWKRYDQVSTFCTMTWSTTTSQVYSVLCFVFLGVVPMTTMSVFYSIIVYILWFKNVVMNIKEKKQQKKRQKATKMIVTVSVIYALAWFPELTVFVISTFVPSALSATAYPITVTICSFNSAINPIIYSFHSKIFRRHLKKLVCCCYDNARYDVSGSVHANSSGHHARDTRRVVSAA